MAANPPPDSYKHPRNSRVNQPTVEMQGLMADEERKPRPFSVKTRRAEEPEPRLAWDRQGTTSEDDNDHGFASTPLYTREKVNPLAMIEQLRKPDSGVALDIFGDFNGLPPDAQRWEFYQYSGHWQNRLIHGDSSQVMQSLIDRDGLGGCVQMIFYDPPFGIGFNSNFMNDSGKLDSTDVPYGDTAPVRTFRDTYKNGIHSYLDEVHERLVLFRELLTDSGSVFMQIGDENVHRLAVLMDEVFGSENRVSIIQFSTSGGVASNTLPNAVQYLLWYGKDKSNVKYFQLFEKLGRAEVIDFLSWHATLELEDGTSQKLTDSQRLSPDDHLPPNSRIYQRRPLVSQGASATGLSEGFWWNGRNWYPPKGGRWRISVEGLNRLAELGRLDAYAEDSPRLMWKKYESEFPGKRINNLWHQRMSENNKVYIVQTAATVISRCILMSTEPGDLVLDPTCGSGVTASCAEHWGRRFITIDVGRVAIAIARRHLITAVHPWYRTNDDSSDPSRGLKVETFQRVSAATIAYDQVNDPENTIPLVDRPLVDKKRHRLTGPFTVESASPFKYLPFSGEQEPSHQNIADPDYQKTLIEEMETNGISNAERRQVFEVTEITPWPKGSLVTHEAFCYKPGSQKRMLVAIMLAAADVTVSATQIAAAASEARQAGDAFRDLVVVASEFDNNASHKAGTVKIHKVVPDRDMQIPGLKKNVGPSTLTLLGEPDVEYRHDEAGNLIVELKGYDTYDPASGRVKPSKAKDVDCWMIDTDHDGSAFFPRLVYLPAYRQNHPQIKKLMKALGKDLSPDAKEALCGLESQPFVPPKPPNEVAVKIITRSGAEMTTTKRFD